MKSIYIFQNVLAISNNILFISKHYYVFVSEPLMIEIWLQVMLQTELCFPFPPKCKLSHRGFYSAILIVLLLLLILFICLLEYINVHRKAKVQVEAGPKIKKAEKFLEEKILRKSDASVLNIVQIHTLHRNYVTWV